jgi:hypothetical protein
MANPDVNGAPGGLAACTPTEHAQHSASPAESSLKPAHHEPPPQAGSRVYLDGSDVADPYV